MQTKSAPVVLALLLALATAACSSSDDGSPGATAAPATSATTGSASGTTSPPSTGRTGDLARARVRLDQIARLDSPDGLATRRGDPAVYVIEQTGAVRALRNG